MPRPGFRDAPRLLATGDEAAVSDVLGSILLVGITVVMAAAFGALLFSYDGPADLQHSRLAITLAPGAGGWGGGDEELRIRHIGGEPLRASQTSIRYAAGATSTNLQGAQLGSAFGDGRLTLGESWTRTVRANVNDAFDVSVVVQDDVGQLLASSRVTAGGQGLLCVGDVQPPAVVLSQSPADVTSQTVGSVTVTARVTDGCAGSNDAVVPRLLWCVDVACTVPTSYTDQGPMTLVGAGHWVGTVPARAWATDALAGRTLRYYVQPVSDLNGNSGASAVAADLVDLLYTYTYVASAAATTGTVSGLDNARDPGNGLEATLTEGGVLGPAGSAGPTQFSGATATSATASSPANALSSDDLRATMGVTGGALEVSGFDLPAAATGVTALTLGFEGRKDATGGTDPTARLDYRIGAGAYVTGSNFPVTNSGPDAAYTRALSGSFTVANTEAMVVRVFHVTDTNRNLQVDRVYITVTYTTAPQTEQRLDVQLEFQGLPNAGSRTVELRYRASGDTFSAQAWDPVTATWRPCAGTLASTVLASFTCALQPNEVAAGEARLRLLDATGGASAATLHLDYARVASL